MRDSSDALRAALTGDFTMRYVADVTLDGVRLIQDLPIISPKFNDDSSSLVQSSGSCTVIYQGAFADSIAPKDIGDVLSPFGTRLAVSVLISVGDALQERIPLGVYLLSETPSIVTQKFLFQGRYVAQGDQIDLNLKDLFYGVQRDDFDAPGSAPSLTSVWSEVQRLTQLPLTRTVADGPIPTSVAYQQDKLQAVYDLATVLNATACMTPDGTVSMRANDWPAVVDTIHDGDGGTLVNVGRAMSNDNVYNKVVIRSSAGDGSAVLATAEITSGPLRTSNADGSLSPYRRVPYFYSSDYITTQDQAQAYAATLLPQISRLRAVSVPVNENFNPLREIGDVVAINWLDEEIFGRVSAITRDDTGQQKTTVTVSS